MCVWADVSGLKQLSKHPSNTPSSSKCNIQALTKKQNGFLCTEALQGSITWRTTAFEKFSSLYLAMSRAARPKKLNTTCRRDSCERPALVAGERCEHCTVQCDDLAVHHGMMEP